MPIFEYEPEGRECLLCDGRVDVLQPLGEDALAFCPYCGLAVRRVVSRTSFQVRGVTDPEQAAKRGFSTFRKMEKGKWEKVAGPEDDGGTPTPNATGPLNLSEELDDD